MRVLSEKYGDLHLAKSYLTIYARNTCSIESIRPVGLVYNVFT